jgi:hypothetical protein
MVSIINVKYVLRLDPNNCRKRQQCKGKIIILRDLDYLKLGIDFRNNSIHRASAEVAL